jgi:glutathione S-transferase
MKIYSSKVAPNPRRVRIFLAEKGIEIPYEEVDISAAVNRQPEFRNKINPMGEVPVLELDDGTHIAESVAICR